MRPGIAKVAFWAWVPVVLVPSSYLLAAHLVPLPRPLLEDPTLASGVQSLGPAGRWSAVHILYGECGCSRRVFDHLLARGPEPGFQESIVLVGDRPSFRERAVARGFQVLLLSEAQLEERFHVISVPMLVLADPRGEVRYAAGYTDTKQGPDIADLRLMRGLAQGTPAEAKPIFGCAVSSALKDQLDPLGLR
ncbi:MAG: hypothetical protein U1E65_02840 [Myxococcota bacterium]